MIVDTPEAGDVGLVQVEGFVGSLIYVGQRLNGASKKNARMEHVMLLVAEKDWILEAQPGGAVLSHVQDRYYGRKIVWVRPVPDLTADQKSVMVREAYKLLGTPYSFIDYTALFLHRFHVLPGLEKRLSNPNKMICSQLVVEVYRRAGVDLFHGRRSGEVTPADFMREYGQA